MQALDLTHIRTHVAEIYNEIVVFISDVSGDTSLKNPSRHKLKRIIPSPYETSYHVPDKELLTASTIKELVFDTSASKVAKKIDLGVFLADYHMPSMVGHSIIKRANAPRLILVYHKHDFMDLTEILPNLACYVFLLFGIVVSYL